MPVFFGPNNKKFQEAAKLKECGGGVEISDYAGFEQMMNAFTSDAAMLKKAGDAAGRYVASNSGATQKLLKALKLF